MADHKWNRKTLRNIGITLANRFNYEELRNLTSDLGIDYGDLEGGIQDSKARSLVKFMYRRDRMEELIEVGKMSRTDIDWDSLIVPSDPNEIEPEVFTEEDFDFTKDESVAAEPTATNIPLVDTLAPAPQATETQTPTVGTPPQWWQNRVVQIGGGAIGLLLVILFAIFGFGSGGNSRDAGPESLVIGTSADNTLIKATRYGGGDDVILFVGGMHSGKSPGTSLISRELHTYLASQVNNLPNNLAIYVIDDLNPDSPENAGTQLGRLNGNGVDPNRNADCNWREGEFSGSAPFSEPETIAFRELVSDEKVIAAIFWGARETNGGVYPAFCGSKHDPSQELAEVYAAASGYAGKRVEEISQGTGEMADWLAAKNTAAITVLLRDHNDPDWARNQRAVIRIIQKYGE